jgi:hypothetical protein
VPKVEKRLRAGERAPRVINGNAFTDNGQTCSGWGPVAGDCGHRHRTIAAGQSCIELDRRRLADLGSPEMADRRLYDESQVVRNARGEIVGVTVGEFAQ